MLENKQGKKQNGDVIFTETKMSRASDILEMLGMVEKWGVETKVSPAEKGEHTNKTIAQLKKELKQPGSDKRELNFAIRAKKHWKGGVKD